MTLHALVQDEFQGRIADDADYYFCDAKGCDVVYFTTDGRTITKPQLKVEVGVKETAGERPLCYCFGHSAATIAEELGTKGCSDALEDIHRKMKDPGCACEVKNPSGSCCLGTVAKGIETAKVELRSSTSSGNKAETISKVGTVVSAIMASSCCWLPLVLLAFGVSGAGIAGALDAYRPLFLTLTMVFLAASFYFTYRPRKSASTSENCCAASLVKGGFEMGMKLVLAALLILPLMAAALLYERNLTCCPRTDASAATAVNSDKSECCPSDKTECCQQEDKADTPRQTTVQGSDPEKQIVFKVEGLRCPAVKGIGCGHMLRPVLAALDKIDGVQASSTNYTGTMIRVSVTSATDRNKVADDVRKVLDENKPTAVVGEELKTALDKEQWRETGRVGELSAIEFRTMALYRIKTFAQAEKLNKETTDKLMKMLENHWERLAQEAKKEKATRPEDWGNRCKKSIPAFLGRAKEVLSDEQVERFKKMLMTPCRGGDRPEAPPAP